MNIVFFGTPDWTEPFLEALAHDAAIHVVGVVTRSDKPAGRQSLLTSPPIKHAADRLKIPVFQFSTLKNSEAEQQLCALNADIFVVVAYGRLIPKEILKIPRLGCVNMHPSLLPRHRGPSPMIAAIEQGDATTGISIMLLDETMDTGPLLAQISFPLGTSPTIVQLIRTVETEGPRLLRETLKQYAAGKIMPKPQSTEGVTVTRLLTREDGQVDWTKSADEILRRFRAYQGWPDSWSVWTRGDKALRLKFLAMEPIASTGLPGHVRVKDGRMFVGTGDHEIEILRVQPEGKAGMDAKDFLRGYSDVNEAVLA